MFGITKVYIMTATGKYFIKERQVSRLRFIISKFFHKKSWEKTELEHK